MKYLFCIFFLLRTVFCFSQSRFEIGYQQNFLLKSSQTENIKSSSINASFLFETNQLPLYAGLTYTYMFFNDKLISSNKYKQGILGLKCGARPLAKALIIPVQPFIEAGYNRALGLVNKNEDGTAKLPPAIKSIISYGGGLEIYLGYKHCIAAYYGLDNYGFETGEKHQNAAAKISLRLLLN